MRDKIMMPTLAFFLPGHTEWIVIAVIGLLIFGKRLPEVGKSLGKTIVEFKKGVKGIESDIDEQAQLEASPKQDVAQPQLKSDSVSPDAPDAQTDTPETDSAGPRDMTAV